MIDPRMDEPEPPDPETRRALIIAYVAAVIVTAVTVWLTRS